MFKNKIFFISCIGLLVIFIHLSSQKSWHQYVGEVVMKTLSWDLSLNHQLLLKGLAKEFGVIKTM